MSTSSAVVPGEQFSAIDQAVVDQRLSASAAQNLKRWLSDPGYRDYVAALSTLLSAQKFAELDRLFWEVIPFGTGGRRGPMADFGSATMNPRTVAESANGLAVYLASVKGQPGGKAAVAYDTRNRSKEFAQITATTFAARGLTVYLFAEHRSTPELSFAVRYLQCDVGVVISASHNPPADNGFKAYWNAGAQVLPPHDSGIIDQVYRSSEIPTLSFEEAVKSGRIQLIGEEVDKAYVAAVVEQSLSQARGIPILFTPLHGVGETSVYQVLRAAGFEQLSIFEGQRKADGNFPGVPRQLPNPELPAVFDPPIEEARIRSIPLILASDPDADRLGAVVRDAGGHFVHLTGNRIGALITDYVVSKRKAAGTVTPQHFVCETLVTTPLIGAIVRAAGLRVIDNLLVGFKYIAQTMDREGPDLFVFGAEESLGYLCGKYARDKDAAVAALMLAEFASELQTANKTLLDRLDELYLQHGYFLESQKSETCVGPTGRAQIDALMLRLATSPPVELAGLSLIRVRDYLRHEVRDLPSNKKASDLPQPEGDMLIFEAHAPDCEITLAVRPSGTEPKIKFYFFARSQIASADQLPLIKVQTEQRVEEFQKALSTWAKHVWAGTG